MGPANLHMIFLQVKEAENISSLVTYKQTTTLPYCLCPILAYVQFFPFLTVFLNQVNDILWGDYFNLDL